MKTREDIIEILSAVLPGLRKRYPLGRVSLFGSYCREEQTPLSDVDLTVEYTGPLSYRDQMALQDELTAALGVRVDIAAEETLRNRVRERVDREAIPL